MQRRRDVICLHGKQSQYVTHDVRGKQNWSFRFRLHPCFSQCGNECYYIYTYSNDYGYRRVTGEYPWNETAKRQHQEKSICFSDFLESIFQGKQKNNQREYLRRRRWQSSDSRTFRELSKKDDTGDDSPDEPSVGVGLNPAFQYVDDIRHVPDYRENRCYDCKCFFHLVVRPVINSDAVDLTDIFTYPLILFPRIPESTAFLQINELRPDNTICIAIQKYQRPARARFGLQIGIVLK